MPDSKIKNLPASIRGRLLNLAQERNDDFGLILTKYGLERMLFRLSRSKYRDTFILKGALLFELWTKERYRATRDADFLAKGDNSPERFVGIFREISIIDVENDGLRFDPKTVKAERIKEDADYEGVRVTLTAFLEKAQIPIQIDIGFGDVIKPGPIEAEYPTLLGLPSPRLLTYPRETVVSEKLEAMVKLGIANSRMKDFHDLHSLSQTFEFGGKALVDAVRATFERRATALPDGGMPLAFTPEFYEDENKIKQAPDCRRTSARRCDSEADAGRYGNAQGRRNFRQTHGRPTRPVDGHLNQDSKKAFMTRTTWSCCSGVRPRMSRWNFSVGVAAASDSFLNSKNLEGETFKHSARATMRSKEGFFSPRSIRPRCLTSTLTFSATCHIFNFLDFLIERRRLPNLDAGVIA